MLDDARQVRRIVGLAENCDSDVGVGAGLMRAARREHDSCSIVSAKLSRYSETRFRNFQVDVDQRDVGPLTACQLQCLGGCVGRSEYRVASILEQCSGTVRDDCFVFDHQYNHTNTSNQRRRGFRPRRHVPESPMSVTGLSVAQLSLGSERADEHLLTRLSWQRHTLRLAPGCS